MRTERSLAALALMSALAFTACRADVEDTDDDGIPEDVDVSIDTGRIDLPDVDITTDTVQVPDIDVTPDTN